MKTQATSKSVKRPYKKRGRSAVEIDNPHQTAISSASVLVDRHQAAAILGNAPITIRRIEADGKLTPIRLRPGPSSKTYYRKSEVFALAGIEKLDVVSS